MLELKPIHPEPMVVTALYGTVCKEMCITLLAFWIDNTISTEGPWFGVRGWGIDENRGFEKRTAGSGGECQVRPG